MIAVNPLKYTDNAMPDKQGLYPLLLYMVPSTIPAHISKAGADLDDILDDAAAVLVLAQLQHGGRQQAPDGEARVRPSRLDQALRHVVAEGVHDDLHRLPMLHKARHKVRDLRRYNNCILTNYLRGLLLGAPLRSKVSKQAMQELAPQPGITVPLYRL